MSLEYVPLVDLSKASPRAPSHTPTVRYKAASFYFRRAESVWHKCQGYHFGVLSCLLVAGTVLLINTVLTVVAAARSGVSDGLGILQTGDCNKTKSLDRWLHLLINILGTLLLGASNYCMQCLSSPTRREIDKAHSTNTWLEIGIPSTRNLQRIARSRLVLWLLLALSSIPLHFLYNSAVFSTTSYQEYSVFIVTEDFLAGANWVVDENEDTLNGMRHPQNRLHLLQNTSSSLQRLEKEQCVEAYGQTVITSNGDVLVVTSQTGTNNSVVDIVPAQDAGLFDTDYIDVKQWFCYDDCIECPCFVHARSSGESCSSDQELCDPGELLTSPNLQNWTYGNAPISHCLSQRVTPSCELQFSVSIMAITLVCNLIKTLCMAIMVWKGDSEPLVTLGDAIASFLDDPDPTTKGKCLASKDYFQKNKDWSDIAIHYFPVRQRWFLAASRTRWLTSNILCLLALIAAAVLLIYGTLPNASKSSQQMMLLGFGAVTPHALIKFNSSSVRNSVTSLVLLANTPQFILSLFYLAYNSLLTSMLLAHEWNGYTHERKSLRVTSPFGHQRSTYRLQLPYTYGIPLLLLSGLLHWLVSQSIFLVRMKAYNYTGTPDPANDISTCGYSPVAILSVIVGGTGAPLLCIANGFYTYRPGIPLVGSCSAGISAACHRPDGDEAASVKKLKWGVVHSGRMESAKEDQIAHCSFSSFESRPPRKGRMYT